MPRRAHQVPLPWVRVDRSMGIPAERQICGALRQAIRQGLLQRGFRLPSMRQLARDVDVSRRVVANAYARLESEGYVASHRGGSTIVTGDAVASRRVTTSIVPSMRAHAMPPLPPRGPLAPGSVAMDEFPWRRWQPPAAAMDLREAIATHICPMRGITATAAEIVLVAGREAALTCAARLLADPGDLVLVENPGDRRTRKLYEHHGLRWRADRLDSEGLAFDTTAGEPRFIHVTPARHYPAGVEMTLGRQYLLLQWAKSIQAAILEEDRDAGARALKASDNDGRVVYVGSFEKLLFPDVGVAFMVMPPHLAAVASGIAVAPSLTTQHILADFIVRGELARHMTHMRAIYDERRDAFAYEVRRRIGEHTPGSALDLVLWLPADRDDEAIAAATGTVALRDCAVTPDEFPPALVAGYGAVTPCDTPVAVENLARAIESAADAQRRA